MSKWRLTPLLVVLLAALTAFTSEPGTLTSELAKVAGLVGLVLFLLLFATRHRVEYRSGDEAGREPGREPRPRRIGRRS